MKWKKCKKKRDHILCVKQTGNIMSKCLWSCNWNSTYIRGTISIKQMNGRNDEVKKTQLNSLRITAASNKKKDLEKKRRRANGKNRLLTRSTYFTLGIYAVCGRWVIGCYGRCLFNLAIVPSDRDVKKTTRWYKRVSVFVYT